MTTGDSEETFRASGMDCSDEVAAIWRAVKRMRENAKFRCGGKFVWREGGIK